MKKDFSITELYDIYGGLLTERQRELFSSYYLYDLSLSEIAEPEGKTRQNVYEQVKKVKNKLTEYEDVLCVNAKFAELRELANELLSNGNPLGNKILEIIGR